jgi:hypothetical protein
MIRAQPDFNDDSIVDAADYVEVHQAAIRCLACAPAQKQPVNTILVA